MKIIGGGRSSHSSRPGTTPGSLHASSGKTLTLEPGRVVSLFTGEETGRGETDHPESSGTRPPV